MFIYLGFIYWPPSSGSAEAKILKQYTIPTLLCGVPVMCYLKNAFHACLFTSSSLWGEGASCTLKMWLLEYSYLNLPWYELSSLPYNMEESYQNANIIQFKIATVLVYPSNADPCVFRPPGSGSVSQRYGSGPFNHQAKIVRKTLIPTVSWLFYYFLSLKNDVNVVPVPTFKK